MPSDKPPKPEKLRSSQSKSHLRSSTGSSSKSPSTPRRRPSTLLRDSTSTAATSTTSHSRSHHRASDASSPQSVDHDFDTLADLPTKSSHVDSVYSRSSNATSYSGHSRDPSASAAFPQTNASNYRDSFSSIVDDPFFQRYDAAFNPDGAGADTEAKAEAEAEELLEHLPQPLERTTSRNPGRARQNSDAAEPPQHWPPPRRESLTASSSQNRPPTESVAMESFNIAVIGATGVGKSSFVQRVLGLSRPPISNASSVRMVLDNATHMITLLELDLEYFELNASQPIQWPKQINGHIVPRVDAALTLYDVTNQDSIRELPQTIAALTNSGLPAIMVACKCEHPEDEREVDVDGMANHELFKSCIASFKISSEGVEPARASLEAILRAAVVHRREENGELGLRRRAQSAANLDAPDVTGGRPLSQNSKHNRASSDLSLLRGFPNAPVTEQYRARSSRGAGQPSPLQADHTPTSIRLDKPSADSFLDVEESDADSYRYSDEIPILQRNDDMAIDQVAKPAGVSFDELVDRLLAPRLSKADINFSEIFLCLYRKFAAPGELFSAILLRLDRAREDKMAHYLTKTATQLRMIEVVARWVSLYPGDFARQATRRNLEDFIRHLSTEPIFSIAAQQIRRNLHFHVAEDDDTGWARTDESDDKLASQILSKEMSELAAGISAVGFEDEVKGRPSGSSDVSYLDRGSNIGSQFQFSAYDEYEQIAATLEPTEHLPLNKNRWHIFMAIPSDDIADELTRIDWVMFSSIRIRDFVRHVSLSTAQKEHCKSLKNVERMIRHFNHVAQWVANMILIRDKAKHRALIMEKFMDIAVKLRQLNNYNGLAAVLAGINGIAIHRLAQTRSLIAPELSKRFQRLIILMGTQKSHFAYRLAWENTPLPRIPFIPLHRRDLVSAEEGSKTFIGPKSDRVNWKKFEVLGEVILPIMKSQGVAYPNISRHDAARELILGCSMPTDDEDIYQRSVQVEGISGGAADSTRKKFAWLSGTK